MLAIKFYLLDCEEILSYTIQDYFWPKSSYLNYFEEPYIPPIREELHIEKNIFLEEYVEVKEENLEISEEINERLIIEEKPEIKIVEENNEDPIIEKDLEVKIVETIKEKIIEEVVNNLDFRFFFYNKAFINFLRNLYIFFFNFSIFFKNDIFYNM